MLVTKILFATDNCNNTRNEAENTRFPQLQLNTERSRLVVSLVNDIVLYFYFLGINIH
jgi:hypothetical protein